MHVNNFRRFIVLMGLALTLLVGSFTAPALAQGVSAQLEAITIPVEQKASIPYLLPENFKVYVKGVSVINHPAPGYEQRVLPTVNQYMGDDGGYIACYSHNQKGSIYPVGGDIYVMGQIRLQGKYIGRVFEPKGYEGKDISAAQEFKSLCNRTFSSAQGGGWAGGDTGGWFGLA